MNSLPHGLFFGLLEWLLYLGIEPAIRRTWPGLLIAWARLIDGRWRDPLVGRSLLVGVLVGLLAAPEWKVLLAGLLDLPGGGPHLWPWARASLGGLNVFLGDRALVVATALELALMIQGVLLVSRLVLRRARLAWAATALLWLSWQYSGDVSFTPAISPWLSFSITSAFTVVWVWLLAKHGAVALATGWFVAASVGNTPWTLDASCWYAWRGPFMMLIAAALAFWGFRNVLGKQSVFPTGALDG